MHEKKTSRELTAEFLGIIPNTPTKRQAIHIKSIPTIQTIRRPILSAKRMIGRMDPRVTQLLMMTTKNGSSTPAAA